MHHQSTSRHIVCAVITCRCLTRLGLCTGKAKRFRYIPRGIDICTPGRSVSASPPRHRMIANAPMTPTPQSPNLLQSHTPTSPRSPAPSSPPFQSQRSLPQSPPLSDVATARTKHKSLFYPSASASLSPTSAGTGTTLTYHLITPQLALVALLPTAVFDSKRGLIEYNAVIFREGVQEICEVEADARRVV